MIVGIGRGPLSYFVWKYLRDFDFIGNTVLPYPLFYDAKRELLASKSAYVNYLRKLQLRRKEVKIAVYPDYVSPHKVNVSLSLLKSIEFIVPIHSLEDIAIVEELKNLGFSVYYGFASDPRYRSYTLSEFMRAAKGRKWYLGVSTKRELQEALKYEFDGADVTAYLFGKNKDRKNVLKMYRMLTEFIKQISKSRAKQTSIYDFFAFTGGKHD
uniref:Putative Mob protein n=1 Tax=Saccharolobus islandicus TaxID=43080 RepID=Q0ZNP4_SACIS|nr:hypothetical protein [Sulfolobus islandicus]ABE99623.1 putative Mob protein [Sulfolobus islandicus]ABE99672.1 putative Mob protein [Sulfolobus islandicus]